MSVTFFTVGYEDARTPGQLVEQLLAAGVERVVVPAGREVYKARLRGAFPWAIDSLTASLEATPTRLLCLETEHRACHRDVVAMELIERMPELHVVHLLA